MLMRKTLIAVVATLALTAGAGTAAAGPPGKWTQVTGIGQDDLNIMRVGLAQDEQRRPPRALDAPRRRKCRERPAQRCLGQREVGDRTVHRLRRHRWRERERGRGPRARREPARLLRGHQRVRQRHGVGNVRRRGQLGGPGACVEAPAAGQACLRGERHRRGARKRRHLLLDLGRFGSKRRRRPFRPRSELERRKPARRAQGRSGRGRGLAERAGVRRLELPRRRGSGRHAAQPGRSARLDPELRSPAPAPGRHHGPDRSAGGVRGLRAGQQPIPLRSSRLSRRLGRDEAADEEGR